MFMSSLRDEFSKLATFARAHAKISYTMRTQPFIAS